MPSRWYQDFVPVASFAPVVLPLNEEDISKIESRFETATRFEIAMNKIFETNQANAMLQTAKNLHLMNLIDSYLVVRQVLNKRY